MLIIPLVLRTRSISATVAHLMHAYHVLSVNKWSEQRSCERLSQQMKDPYGGNCESFSIRIRLQTFLPFFDGLYLIYVISSEQPHVRHISVPFYSVLLICVLICSTNSQSFVNLSIPTSVSTCPYI